MRKTLHLLSSYLVLFGVPLFVFIFFFSNALEFLPKFVGQIIGFTAYFGLWSFPFAVVVYIMTRPKDTSAPLTNIRTSLVSENTDRQIKSSKKLLLAVGCVVAFYFSAHHISGPLGGLILIVIGWALPIASVIFFSLYIYERFFEKLQHIRKPLFVGFVVVLIGLLSFTVDSYVYRLHKIGGDEGCGCLYFTYGSGQPNHLKEYMLRNVSFNKFFRYTTEAYLKGLHFNLQREVRPTSF